MSLRFLLHRLAGSGTSFGVPEVTHAARAAENIVARAIDESRPLTPAERLFRHIGCSERDPGEGARRHFRA